MAAGVDFSDYFWVRRTSVKFASVFLTQDTYLHMNLFTHEVLKEWDLNLTSISLFLVRNSIFLPRKIVQNGFGSEGKSYIVKILKVKIILRIYIPNQCKFFGKFRMICICINCFRNYTLRLLHFILSVCWMAKTFFCKNCIELLMISTYALRNM